jgi:tRNA G18 (ribose-2'-O)-methylase SpoU
MRPEPIDDPRDPRVDDYRDLRDPERRRHGVFVVEGRLAVTRLVDGSRYRARSLLLTPGAGDALIDVLGRLDDETRVYVADAAVVQAVVGFPFHRGCLAIAERGADLPLDRLVTPAGRRALVLLEDIADPDNVGAIFRNALAFGADGVLLSAGAADPLYRKAIRTSAAATLRVPFARVHDWREAFATLRAHGYTTLALTPDADAADIADVRTPPERLALVVGAEGPGLSVVAREAADLAVRIPMAAGIDSLNVATASGIALHRLLRRPR